MGCHSVTVLVIVSCLLPFCQVLAATPVSPAFTYQGQIQQGGVPVNTPVHLRFSLWTAAGTGQPPSGGTQIGASQLLNDVPVAGGLFTVLLNGAGEFGPNPFNGEARWLQIEVCADPGCSTLSILSPRQPLTGVPYALTAVSAPWSGLTDVPEGFADKIDNIGDPVWGTNGTSISYNSGSVGIGTTSPDTKLQVNDGRIRIRESATLERWDLFYDPPSEKFYLQENAAYNHIVFTKGPDARVSLGTNEPENARLTVNMDQQFGAGVRAESLLGSGVLGIARRSGAVGVDGYNSPDGIGVLGNGKTGVVGISFVTGGVGVEGRGEAGVTLAGRFLGDVDVTGNVLKSSDSSRIDHPLDPANKYLFHSSVESSEMKDIYDGNVMTDGEGHAEIALPDWFEALNRDFRYQLTVIGQFAEAIVSREIQNSRFEIQTDKPKVKVSWQVTGIRNDPYAKAHPLEVEKDKPEGERGKYLAPELYGQPKEMGIRYRPGEMLPPGLNSEGE